MSFTRQLDFFRSLVVRVAKTVVPKPESPAGIDAALTEQARALLIAIGATKLAAQVAIRWNPRMRSTAGTANYAKALITLNPRLREVGGHEIDRTLRHELAHLLAQHRAGRRRIAAHGAEWRRACADLGIGGEARCHTLPLPSRRLTRRHIYRCPACGSEIRRVRPIHRTSACLPCCRRHNCGRYDERFRLVKTRAAT